MAEWWTRRSMAAAVVIWFLKIRSHSPNMRLLVMSSLVLGVLRQPRCGQRLQRGCHGDERLLDRRLQGVMPILRTSV